MANQLRNFINGIGGALAICPSQGYIIPQRGDFLRDVQRLGGDAEKVATGLKKTVKLYGKQIHKS